MKKEKKIDCPLYGTCPFVTDIAIMKNDIAWIKRLLFAIIIPVWLTLIAIVFV